MSVRVSVTMRMVRGRRPFPITSALPSNIVWYTAHVSRTDSATGPRHAMRPTGSNRRTQVRAEEQLRKSTDPARERYRVDPASPH